MGLEVVNEGGTAYLTVTFLDRDGAAQAPASVSYRIDDVASGQEVLGDTDVSPGSSVLITLRPSDNAMVNAERHRERRRVTVTAVYEVDDALPDAYDYVVRNLRFG